MRFIKPCPQCRTPLRFPIDQGKLQVVCPHCRHAFTVDPDDPGTFEEGAFKLGEPGGQSSPERTPRPAAWRQKWDSLIYSSPILSRLRDGWNRLLRKIPRSNPTGPHDKGQQIFQNLGIVLITIIFLTLFFRLACPPGIEQEQERFEPRSREKKEFRLDPDTPTVEI